MARKKKSRKKKNVNPYSVCWAMKKKHDWSHSKWKRCVKDVSKK